MAPPDAEVGMNKVYDLHELDGLIVEARERLAQLQVMLAEGAMAEERGEQLLRVLTDRLAALSRDRDELLERKKRAQADLNRRRRLLTRRL